MKAYAAAGVVLRLALLVGTAGVLVGQLGRMLPQVDPLNALLPLLLPYLALLFALALRWRDRMAALVGLVGLLVGGVQFGSACFPAGPGTRQTATTDTTLRVLTLSTWHSNPRPWDIRHPIDTQRPDIAFLQETNLGTAMVVAGLLPGYHRARSCMAQHCSLTILSRWPIRRIIPPSRPGASLPDILLAEVDAPAPFGRFRVINVHLPRPNDGNTATFKRQLVALSLTYASDPLIIAGDFNTATGSFGLIEFAKSTGLQQLEGFTPTYPAHLSVPAFIGIDHLFASPHWATEGCRRTQAGGSDHNGVACLVSIRAGAEISHSGPSSTAKRLASRKGRVGGSGFSPAPSRLGLAQSSSRVVG